MKDYMVYGLTTLKDGHVDINGATIKFSFKGKKGVYHSVTLKNKRLAKDRSGVQRYSGKGKSSFSTSMKTEFAAQSIPV